MKLRRSRGDDAPEAADDSAKAWIAPPPRAALATAATKIALWGLVACGPVALLAAAASPASSQGGPVTAVKPRSATGPGGFAELYVAAYVRAANGDTSLRAFFPAAPTVSNPPGQRAVSGTVVTDAREVAPGYWSVTVAADVAAKDEKGAFAATRVHYFKVAIVASGDTAGGGIGRRGSAPGYVATALPAEVAAPAPVALPGLAYDTQRQISSGPLADTVRQALAAYLSGTGDLSRYLSPGTDLRPVDPAPYRQVEVSGITLTRNLPDADTAVPADGTRASLLAEVEVTDATGQRWPLTYALTVSARAGRWELATLGDAPVLGAPKSPAASPSPSVPATAPQSPASPSGSPSPESSRPGTPDTPSGSPPNPSATPSH